MKLLTPKHLHSLARVRGTADGACLERVLAKAMEGHELNIKVHADFTQVCEDWLALQRDGWTTLYQSLQWCEAWCAACAGQMQVEPCIVSAHDRTGRAVFILPFGIYPVSGGRVLRWLSHSACTYGLGLYDTSFLERNGGSIAEFWPGILAALPDVDAIRLEKMPRSLDDRPHPLAKLFTADDANVAYRIALQPDFGSLYRQTRTSRARSQARSKDRKLAGLGNIRFGLPQTCAATHGVLTAMFEQQIGRLAERGVHGVFETASVQFVHDLADLPATPDGPNLRAYTLWLNDRIVAVKLGMEFKNTYWALISSLNADGIERLSPGDLALRRTIEACCASRLGCLDMADGDPGYKASWASERVPLASISIAFTLRGRISTSLMGTGSAAKKWIKDRDGLWRLAQQARKAVLGRPRR